MIGRFEPLILGMVLCPPDNFKDDHAAGGRPYLSSSSRRILFCAFLSSGAVDITAYSILCRIQSCGVIFLAASRRFSISCVAS